MATANASQVTLESYGVTKPHITFMRTNMGDPGVLNTMKLEALRDRKAGLLVLFPDKRDPNSNDQLAHWANVNYRFDDLLIMNRTDCYVIYNGLLNPQNPLLLWRYRPSMGIRAILFCLAMGAERVAVSGVSFRLDGCSFSDIDYKRIHVADDLKILRRMHRLGLPVYAVDEELAVDSGLERWHPIRGAQVAKKGVQFP